MWGLRRQARSRIASGLVPDDATFTIDGEVSHLTRLQSEPYISDLKAKGNKWNKPISTTAMLLAREANCFGRGRFSLADRAHVLGHYLPVNTSSEIDRMDSEAYISQFSVDGSLLVAGFQGSLIKIYDVDKEWKVQKKINARSLRWTVTDTSLSPDQRLLVYCSLTPVVHVVNMWTSTTDSQANITEIHEGLDFSASGSERETFNIYSIKFSTDGRELIAGTGNASIYVYDLEAKKLALRLPAHTDDVNTVAFADESGHVLFSGSDDHLCKVWDKRCYGTTGKPAGVLEGHLQGITFIDSRGDGRYFISNGKDQTTKLWDMRRMSSSASISTQNLSSWDYRWMEYPDEARQLKHSSDRSVATYRGHSVLGTLIRCYFSPAHSTGQRYIYTGSYDNCVYIYDVVTGKTVSKLAGHAAVIRDCSWHPYHPMLVTSSWDCCVTKWEFPSSLAEPGSLKKKSRRKRQV